MTNTSTHQELSKAQADATGACPQCGSRAIHHPWPHFETTTPTVTVTLTVTMEDTVANLRAVQAAYRSLDAAGRKVQTANSADEDR